MKTARLIMVMGVGLSLSACASVDVSTRNLPYETLPQNVADAPAGYQAAAVAAQIPVASTAAAATQEATAVTSAQHDPNALPDLQLLPGQAPITVDAVRVRVPRSLEVSERNSYLPFGDIVWREDPIGDRHAQVATIVQDALTKGVAPLNGPVHVNLEVQVNRFHALTEKARYTTGGVHSISFDMMLTDPKTGQVLVPRRTVNADLQAFGGRNALEAEARGLTQKVRISDYLAEVIRQELTEPEGYKNAQLGLIQLANRF